MSSEPVLTYFEGRGRAELLRMTLCLAKIQFKQNFVHNSKEFHKLQDDGKLFFNQLPLLEMDGMMMTQTSAIARYVADKGNLIPTDPKDKFRMDMLYEGSRDFYSSFSMVGFTPEADTNEKMKTANARYLPVFEKELKRSGTGYLVGSSVTLADVGLFEVLLSIIDYFGESKFDDLPCIQKFLATMRSLPEMVTYINKIRHKPNDAAYVEEVKETLFTPRK